MAIKMTEGIHFSKLYGIKKFAFIMEIIFFFIGLIGALGIILEWLF